MVSISEDIGKLESGTGYIPDVVHEHTTVSVTGVVVVVLAIILVILYFIWKKYGNMREQLGIALRSFTP